jgi:hypothetical protein
MARRDPLAVLARLRGIERDAARRVMSDAQARLAGAEAARCGVEQALITEAGAAVADYAAWLPAARRAGAAAAARVQRAEAGAEVARVALVGARIQAEAVERMLRDRRDVLRRARQAAEQVMLEDAARGV